MALGRGLESLIPGSVDEPVVASTGVTEIDINLIDPNVHQPRKAFDDVALRELADSIALHGVVQPLILQKKGDRYIIVAGERRWRACRLAGIKNVPAVLKEYSPQQLMEVSLIENLQREDLNPIEEALAIDSLMKEYGLTQEEVASRVGKSRPAIANTLRLLVLPTEIIDMVRAQSLSAGHARALIGVPEDKQLAIARMAVKDCLSVREVERMAALVSVKPTKKKTITRSEELEEFEGMLRAYFGTKVKLVGDSNKGHISIEYFSRADLDRIFDRISEQ